MELKRIGVVGAGQMGSGIAQVASRAGLEVVLNDVEEALLRRGLERIEEGLQRWVRRGEVSQEEAASIRGRIKGVLNLEGMRDVDFVVEAVVEDYGVKKGVFEALDRICRPEVILASNTSSIPITRLASATGRPDRVIGMHFMNPVPVMKLVEVVRGLTTSQETFETTWDLALRMGKTPVEAGDSPGFISNRILMPMINEAVFALYEGVGSPEAIDQVMKLGMNHPMGPLELADLIGLDTCLAILETLYQGFGDPKYRPCPLLRRYVEAGYLGRKTGRGFYTYGG